MTSHLSGSFMSIFHVFWIIYLSGYQTSPIFKHITQSVNMCM